MKIISLKICPFVQRVTALLAAKAIAYDIEYINRQDMPPWFLEISPHGQAPVLITDKGVALFESDAIVEYLEEAYPALQPTLSLEDKAVNRAWSYLASRNYLVQCSAQRSPNAATLEQRRQRLSDAFDKIEARLGDTAFFSGESLGMVDIAWLPLLHRADIIDRKAGFDFVGNRPKLKQWQRRLLDTGIAEQSVAPDFERIFSDFYLSNETFLGNGRHVERRPVGIASPAKACCQR